MSRILRLKIWERLKICYFRLSTRCENFPDQQHTVKNKLSTVLQGRNNHHCQWAISSVKKLSITQSPEASLGAVSGSDSGRVSPPRTYSYAHPADSQLWGKIQHVLRNVKFSQSWSPQAVLFRMLTGKEQTEHTGYGKKMVQYGKQVKCPRTNKELRTRGNTERKPSRWGQNSGVREKILNKGLSSWIWCAQMS